MFLTNLGAGKIITELLWTCFTSDLVSKREEWAGEGLARAPVLSVRPLPICILRAICRRALCQLSDLPVLPALRCLLLGSGCCQGMSVVWLLSEKSQGYLRLPPTASAFILHPSLHHSHCNFSSEDNILPCAQTASYSDPPASTSQTTISPCPTTL